MRLDGFLGGGDADFAGDEFGEEGVAEVGEGAGFSVQKIRASAKRFYSICETFYRRVRRHDELLRKDGATVNTRHS